jgi:AraC-like DNA-binding protein
VKTRTTNAAEDQPPQTPAAIDLAALQNLFDQVPDVAFFVKDVGGRYVVVNQSLALRHGFRERSQVIGKRPSDICPGDFGGVPARQDADVLRTGRPLIDHLELHWYEPQRPGWCLTTKLPLRNTDGQIIGLIGVSRDVRAAIPPTDIPPGVAEALAAFEENFDEPVTPAMLARQAGLSPSRFARLIHRVFGLTPTQYIAKVRISAASRMLRETNRTVAQIAQACGFYDHSAFTRSFRRLTGLTPLQARKQSHGSAS